MVLRTWLVMGLIEPVTVAGSSMAPTLLGPHVSVPCDRCQHRFDVGADFAAESDNAECPQCGFRENLLAELPLERGDRMVIDRTAFLARRLQRWEPVVFVSPEDEGNLVVKRVVGLPGETIQLRDGEVLIHGELARKSLSAQNTLRRLVHSETPLSSRWRGDGWSWTADSWKCIAKDGWHWLDYVHPTTKPITDDSAYNAGLTRRLFAVHDLCLSIRLKVAGKGELAIRMNPGMQDFEFHLNVTSGECIVTSGGELLTQTMLPQATSLKLQNDEVLLEISSFDQRCTVSLDGVVQLENEIERPDSEQANSPAPTFFVGAKDVTVSLRDLQIYRDSYFASHEEMLGFNKPMSEITLSDGEIFVLGDNGPVSLDSRHWGPLPLRFLVGRPIGVR